MGKYKKLAKNSFLFALSNFGSKLLLLVFVPFYTYVLGTEEYGTVDTLTTTISLLLPICTLVLHEAVLRFSMKSSVDNHSLVTNAAFAFGVSSALSLVTYFFFSYVDAVRDYWFMFYIILVFENLNYLLRQFARGIGRITLFAINGILNTSILVLCNLLFLLSFKMGINGYLLSIAISYIVCDFILLVFLRIDKLVRRKFYDKRLLKEMLVYCIPLIPNTVMWWVMNASDRYVIAFFLGLSANGIYAVACKVPSIINTLQQIFMQAWQLSAIEESESPGSFYNNIYGSLNVVLSLCASAILIIIKPFLSYFISSSYEDVWKYVPWLLIASVYSGMASFLGTNYMVKMKTQGVLHTSIVGAVVNLLLNLVTTPVFGINGPAFATAMSYFVLWVLRCRDADINGGTIKQDVPYLAISGIMLLTQTVVTISDVKYSVLINSALFAILVVYTYFRKKELIEFLFDKISKTIKNIVKKAK